MIYFSGAATTRQDPYYDHFTDESRRQFAANHFRREISLTLFNAPDDGRYFVDTFSRVDAAPKSILLDDPGQ